MGFARACGDARDNARDVDTSPLDFGGPASLGPMIDSLPTYQGLPMTSTTFRTDDLALATFLNYSGFKHLCLERKKDHKRSAEWVFDSSDELDSTVESYRDHTAKVEPLKFSMKTAEVRNEMYSFVKLTSGN